LETEDDDDDDLDGGAYPIHTESVTEEMGIARVYDRTMVELGDLLGGSPIGIITDQ
jgi:hypothetical protein